MEKGSIKGMVISTGLIFLAVTGAMVAAHAINNHVLNSHTKVQTTPDGGALAVAAPAATSTPAPAAAKS